MQTGCAAIGDSVSAVDADGYASIDFNNIMERDLDYYLAETDVPDGYVPLHSALKINFKT